MLMLFADAAVEVAQFPYLLWWVLVGCLGLLAGLIKYLFWLHEQRIGEKFKLVEEHNTRQDRRLDKIDDDVRKYDQHVAIGQKDSNEIHTAVKRLEAALADHVLKEEGTTWAKIDGLVDVLNVMKSSNEIAHAGLVNNQNLLNLRVDSMEKKMPNGEIQALVVSMARIEAQMTEIKRAAESATQHVVEHNEEAEEWKRRILLLESGIKNPAKAKTAKSKTPIAVKRRR